MRKMNIGIGFAPGGQCGGGATFDPVVDLAAKPFIWIDPYDLDSMYQESNGKTPVTASGQPVGLVLDKSQGAVRGANLITNGNNGVYSADITGVTGLNASVVRDTAIFSTGSVKATVTTPSVTGALLQTLTLTAGELYEVTCDGYVPSSNTTKVLNIGLGGVSTGLSSNVSVADAIGSMRCTFTSGSGATEIRGYIHNPSVAWGATSDVGYFKNLTVKHIPGRHIFGVPGNTPTYIEDGDLRAIAFNGTSQFLYHYKAPGFSTDKMVIIAGKESNSAAQGIYFNYNNNETLNGYVGLVANATSAGGSGYYANTFRGTAAASVNLPTSFPINNRHVVTAIGDIAAPLIAGRVDGVEDATSAATQGTGNYAEVVNMSIGARLSNVGAASQRWSGRIYQMFIVGDELTPTELSELEAIAAVAADVAV